MHRDVFLDKGCMCKCCGCTQGLYSVGSHCNGESCRSDSVSSGMQIHRMSMADLRKVMRDGNMLLPSITTCFLAIAELQTRGFAV